MTKVYVDETIKENAVLQTKVEFVQNILTEGLNDEIIKKVAMIDDRRLAEIKGRYQKSLK